MIPEGRRPYLLDVNRRTDTNVAVNLKKKEIKMFMMLTPKQILIGIIIVWTIGLVLAILNRFGLLP
jgi:hypothetical protein